MDYEKFEQMYYDAMDEIKELQAEVKMLNREISYLESELDRSNSMDFN